MPEPLIPVFVADLRQALQIPEKGIASRILQNDEASKVVLFRLATGHEMRLHAAPVPTILYFVEGEATLTLGDEKMTVRTGALTHMPSHLKHAIAAGTPVLMLLIMVK
jgi:quercetin dioxygenase-like cupin family protein